MEWQRNKEMEWQQVKEMESKSFVCGYCGNSIASVKGYVALLCNVIWGSIYICHHCENPTFFDIDKNQTPGPIFGQTIHHITDRDVESLYNEARVCFTHSAYTSVTMCCRKLLMNIAVSEGAKEGMSFVEYVNYLDGKSFIPPKGKVWVDKVRKFGNEANHCIEFKTVEDAKLMIRFVEMLLKIIYEMPGLLKESTGE